MKIHKVLAIFTIISFTYFKTFPLVVCHAEFEVGESNGWIVPSSNDTNFYNKWASGNRFKVTDTLRKYNIAKNKDSILGVREFTWEKTIIAVPVEHV